MSLINEALKTVRKASPPPSKNPPPLQPAIQAPQSSHGWWPALLVLVGLLAVAMFLIGWATVRRQPQPAPGLAMPTPNPAPTALTTAPAATPTVAPINAPAAVRTLPAVGQPASSQMKAAALPATPAVDVPKEPKLQGIYYSVTAPTAFVDGKIVHPGDAIRQYHVKTITQNTVTLVGPDRKETQLTMGK